MGRRAQVLVSDTGVYLYTHWDAEQIERDVKTALAKKWRWDDPEYLARIIFCEMVKGAEMAETGYAIGSKIFGDIEKLIIVDCGKQQVTVKDIMVNEQYACTFDEFIKQEG